MATELTTQPHEGSPFHSYFVLDGAFVERLNEIGRELGLPRNEGETSLRYAHRLLQAKRLPAPSIAGLLAA